MSMVKYVESVEEFKKYASEKKVVMDFFAEWCGPCKMLTPVLEEVSKKMEDILFVKCDIDRFPDIASAFKVMSVPTLIYFQDGQAITGMSGYLPEPQLVKWINDAQQKAAK